MLGRHKTAIEVLDECLKMSKDDWEVYFYRGLSCKFLRQYDEAIENFMKSNEVQVHENTFIELGRMY